MPPELHPLSREQLADIIVTERKEREQLADIIVAQRAEIAALRSENADAQAKIDFVHKKLFAPTSEKTPYVERDGIQHNFLATPVEHELAPPAAAPTVVVPAHARTKKGHGRKPVSRDLPIVEHIIPASDADKIGPNGEALMLLGYEESEKLDIVPEILRLLRIKREKWGLPDTRETLHVAPVQPCLIPKGKATDAFMLDVILNKYQLSMPLYRQVGVLNARGADVNPSWMSDIVQQTATRFAPIHDALRDYLLQQRVLHVDETPIRQLVPIQHRTDKNADKTVRTSYYWAWLTAERERAQCYIHYDPTRSQTALRHVLKIPDDDPWTPTGCIALLMSDGYAAYNLIDTVSMASDHPRIERVACWIHIRRPFQEAVARSGDTNAATIVDKINTVFRIEKTIQKENDKNGRRDTERYAYTLHERQLRAAPIIDDIKKSLLYYQPFYTESSELRKAIDHALRSWEQLTVCLRHGDAPLDNNTAERAIRPLALGRKNWLFVGSEDAGTWSAIFLSLIESCRLQKIDPRRYFEYVTKIIIQRDPNTDYRQLIPIKVKDKLGHNATV